MKRVPSIAHDSNIRPGRGRTIRWLRGVANRLRTWVVVRLRYRYVTARGAVRIPLSVSIWSPGRSVELGDRVQFGPRCMISCDIKIGNSVLIAPDVAFIGRSDHGHRLVGVTMWDGERGEREQIEIGSDVWIGQKAIILGGVVVGSGSIVAAGSVVSREVPQCAIVAGVPARVISYRFAPEDIPRHLESLREQGIISCPGVNNPSDSLS